MGVSLKVEELVEKLDKAASNGKDSWMARCPAHKDRTPSLSITVGSAGQILLHCFAGCSVNEIIGALGIQEADLFPESGKKAKRDGGVKVTAPLRLAELALKVGLPTEALVEYGCSDGVIGVQMEYRGEHGRPLYSRARLSLEGGQRFRMPPGQTPTPYGVWKLDEARKPASPALVIVEGESDCWTLWHCGIPALGLPGANTVGALEAEHVEGFKSIFVIEEADKAGNVFAEAVCERIRSKLGSSAKLKIVKMARLGVKDPNELWHAADQKRATFISRFRDACKKALDYEDSQIGDLFMTFADVASKRVDFLWHPYIVQGALNMMAGKPGAGKSFLSCEIVAMVTSGKQPPGWDQRLFVQGKALMIFAEDEPSVVKHRLLACGADLAKVHLLKVDKVPQFQLADSGMRTLLAYVEKERPVLVVIDPVASFLESSMDMNSQNDVYASLSPLIQIATTYGTTFLLVAHQKKGASAQAAESIIGSQGFQSVVRSVVIVSVDPEDDQIKLFTHAKHNLSERGDTWQFMLTREQDPRVQWLRKDDRSANDVSGNQAADPDARADAAEAKDLLAIALANGPRNRMEVVNELKKSAVPMRAIRRAAHTLSVEMFRIKTLNEEEVFWKLPSHPTPKGVIGMAEAVGEPPPMNPLGDDADSEEIPL